ncbi:MAG: hypothetical protein WC046_07085 [Candidatus Bathyarchaeia archaeon]
MKKGVAAVLILLIVVLILVAVKPITAQSIPTPSVPEFTLKLIDNSYDVPTTTTSYTNPYTGEVTTKTHPGYHVSNKTIQVTIKNQPFTSYSLNDNMIYLFYNITYKGHYEDNWAYYPWNGSFSRNSYAPTRIHQSTSDYTEIQLSAPTEGQMDFRVQAQIGYYTEHKETIPVPGAPFSVYTFHGEVSGWSNTQTITIDSTSTSTPNPTPPSTPNPTTTLTPTESPGSLPSDSDNPIGLSIEQLTIIALIIAVIGLSAALLLSRKRKVKPVASL